MSVPFLSLVRTFVIKLRIVTADECQAKMEQSAPTRQPWWRTLYNRISQSGRDADGENESFIPRKSSYKLSHPNHLRTDARWPDDINRNIDDHPPPSLLHPPSHRSPMSLRDYNQYDFYEQDRRSVLPLNYGPDGFGRMIGHPSSTSSSPPRRMSFHRGIGAVYHDPYEALGSVYSHLRPTNTRKHHDRPSTRDLKKKPRSSQRSSHVPSRPARVLPALLSSDPDVDFNPSWKDPNARHTNQDDRPPHLSPKDDVVVSCDESDWRPNASYRRSTHRREAAYVPLNQHCDPEIPISPVSGLPMGAIEPISTFAIL